MYLLNKSHKLIKEIPLGRKPIFTHLERHKLGTSHVMQHVRHNLFGNLFQRRTGDGIRNTPGQTGVGDEESNDEFPHALSRLLISTDVDLFWLDQDLNDGKAMK